MSHQVFLLIHPFFGGLATLAALWVFVEALNASAANEGRIKNAGLLTAACMWVTYVLGGYWYVVFYGADKAMIKEGPWAFAHGLFMESKEHIFLMLLVLSTFLAIAAYRGVATNAGRRLVTLTVAGLVVVTGLAVEGAGAIIAMGVKVSLLAKQAGGM